MIQSARDKKASVFRDTFNSELANRVADKLDIMKSSIAKTLFTKSED